MHVVGELRCGLCQQGPGELTGLQGGLHSLDHTRADPGVPGPSVIAPREPVLQTPRAQLLSRHGRVMAMSTMVSEKMGGTARSSGVSGKVRECPLLGGLREV